MQESGGGSGGIIGAIASFVSSLFFGGGFQADIAFNYLLSAANFLLHLIQAVWNLLRNWFQWIFNFLKDIFETYLLPLIRKIAAIYKKIHAFIQHVLNPVLKIIRRIRDWYIKHILPWQELVIEIIARVRVALALLRLLGVKWAAKLDAELQKIQGWVTQSIQDVVGTLNTVQSYLDLIVDPGMIIRGDFFAATLFSSLKSLKNAVGFGSNAPLSAAEQQRLDNDKSLMNPATPFARTDASGHLQTTPAFDAVQGSFANAVRDVLR